MINLYHSKTCPFSARVRLVFAEKEIPYRSIEVNLEHPSPRLLELNPLNPEGLVPVINDHGLTIYESRIIVEYLEERFPAQQLMPKTPARRARVRMLQAFCDN